MDSVLVVSQAGKLQVHQGFPKHRLHSVHKQFTNPFHPWYTTSFYQVYRICTPSVHHGFSHQFSVLISQLGTPMGRQKSPHQITIGVLNQIHHWFFGRFPSGVLNWDTDSVPKVQLKCPETTDYGSWAWDTAVEPVVYQM
jgi:hypothetical protein